MGAELMLGAGGVTANHVPFKGASESLNAVIGKQVDFALTISSVALPQWKAGKVAALGITSAKRNPALAAVPTLIEQGWPASRSFPSAAWPCRRARRLRSSSA
ncbi:MAG: tripartite tricarboxylate transporter substrate-binding protein [Rubrivivax sp.]